MSLPGTKALAGAGGIRQWLSTVVLSAVALVLTLVVISLSVGSSLPGTSLHTYLGSKNGTAADFLLSGGLFQGDQEPLPEQNTQSGAMNSSEASLDSREVNRKMPEAVATGDTDTTAKLDEGTVLDLSKSSTDFRRAVQVEVLVYSRVLLHKILQT